MTVWKVDQKLVLTVEVRCYVTLTVFKVLASIRE
jgi:hypothetical protein